MQTRVLVVDDERSILDLLSTALEFEGYDVHLASTGEEALQLAQGDFDAILLDVMLPGMDGFEVATKLREQGMDTPILFLSARDGVDDRVKGLLLGGDDYVTKPFSLSEVSARLQAVLRRTKGGTEENKLSFADLVMDDDTREVTRSGVLVDLTATEYKLLHYLLSHPRKVLTRAALLQHVWEYDFGGDGGILETYISYLRKKVDAVGDPLVHTVRGVGYTLREPRG